ncbi:MAG: hypothetical protein EOP06_29635, partial [Proteobacteria bacterium]
MKIFFIILIPLLSFSKAYALLCEPYTEQPLAKFPLQSSPNYFFKIFPDGTKATFASDSGNWMYDLQKKKYFPIPGDQDAVPLGTDIVTTPKFKSNVDVEGMEFYRVEDILAQNSTSQPSKEKSTSKIKPVFVDPSMKGMYQSTSHLDGSTYRVLTDELGLTIRDYSVSDHGRKVLPKGASKQICTNSEMRFAVCFAMHLNWLVAPSDAALAVA